MSQAQVRVHLLQTTVFRLQLFQAPQLRSLQTTLLGLPFVVRRTTDLMLAAQLIDRQTFLGFFEDACNPAFRKPTSFHGDLLLKREWGAAYPICLYLEMALSKGNRTRGGMPERDVGTVVAYSLSRGWTVPMLHPLPEECKTNCGN